MAKTQPENRKLQTGISAKTLGIGNVIEDDRFELDARGAIQLIRFRIDTQTQYYNRETGEGGILKFDGFDIATGQAVKYRTTSKVQIGNFLAIKEKVGSKPFEDENGIVWQEFLSPVDIDGFEKVKSSVKGHNPYIKMIL